MRRSQYLVLLFAIWFFSCHTPQWIIFSDYNSLISLENESIIPRSTDKTNYYQCKDKSAYLYDPKYPDHTDMKYIRINLHFINSLDSTANFSGQKAIDFGKSTIYYANEKLADNRKMYLPLGNETPVYPIGYRYVITPQPNDPDDVGVYQHYVDYPWFFNQGRKRNDYDKKMVDSLSIGKDSILNLFFMVHNPDSLKSKNYRGNQAGIALGTIAKIGYPYDPAVKNWIYATLVNHEIGHVLGLSHTWAGNDGCDDTPKNPNCWNFGSGLCDSLVSNNVMDYNSQQHSFTPCQIAKTYSKLSKGGNRRNLVIKKWCDYQANKSITIRDTVVWEGSKDVHGNIIIEDEGLLQINCQVHLPKGGGIYIKKKGALVLNQATLYNDCGEQWKGIHVEKDGNQEGKVYKVGEVQILDTQVDIHNQTDY